MCNEENRYEIMVNLDAETKKVYKKYFETEEYQLLVDEATILFVKKQNGREENTEYENSIVQLILNMVKKYFYAGILYINMTYEINAILKKSKKIEKLNVTDNYITLPIKRAIEKAILNKNGRKIELEEEKQNYEEQYILQKEKYIKLFREMLNFIQADYEKDREDFEYLQSEIIKYFPFYSNILIHLSVRMWSVDETYPELLEGMEDIYNKLARDYKNYEQLMAEYDENEDEFYIEEEE